MSKGTEMRFVGVDPSTKTGFVILDSKGNVVEANDIVTKATTDPERMIEMVKRVRKHLSPATDKIIIEGFSYGSQGKNVDYQYGVGWALRIMFHLEGMKYIDVAPTSLKKFASSNGRAKKDALVLPIYKKWGFEHPSDNSRDAYVLARIGYSMYNHDGLLEYEKDVLRKLKKI